MLEVDRSPPHKVASLWEFPVDEWAKDRSGSDPYALVQSIALNSPSQSLTTDPLEDDEERSSLDEERTLPEEEPSMSPGVCRKRGLR